MVRNPPQTWIMIVRILDHDSENGRIMMVGNDIDPIARACQVESGHRDA